MNRSSTTESEPKIRDVTFVKSVHVQFCPPWPPLGTCWVYGQADEKPVVHPFTSDCLRSSMLMANKKQTFFLLQNRVTSLKQKQFQGFAGPFIRQGSCEAPKHCFCSNVKKALDLFWRLVGCW